MKQSKVLNILSDFQKNRGDEYQIIRMGVFGSLARNQMTENSDVDVVVELARPDLLAMVGIKQDLEEVLNCPVDIVRYRNRMNSFLKQHIEQEAVYV